MVWPFYIWEGRVGFLKQIESDDDGKEDYISELPDDILLSILSRLSLRDAAKTSILSTRWRYLYASIRTMPHLNFDFLTMFGLPKEDHVCRRYLQKFVTMFGLPAKDHVCPQYVQKFVEVINQCIQLYSGPRIISFRFDFCFQRKSAADIERWISFAIRMDVEELDINCRCKMYLSHKHYRYNYNKLPTFSCDLLSEASKLKRLHLLGCILTPSFNVKINSLKSLELDGVPLAGREVKDILSCCLNLERLRLTNCILPAKLCIHGPSLRLKDLSIHFSLRLKTIDLCAINLTFFECFDHELVKFSFFRVPKLQTVFLYMNRPTGMPYIFNELPMYLPRLKTLIVHIPSMQVRYIPARITLFRSLKELELILKDDGKIDLLKIITPFLSACPLLQQFYLTMFCTSEYDIETVEPPPCHHTQLEEVVFHGFEGTQNWLTLALYFLRSAVALKQMVINWNHERGDAWSDKEHEMIRRRLQEKALSESAKVIVI